MKLIITGATGSVATEVLRQSLRNPAITSVIAVSRKPVTGLPNLSSDSDISKLQSVIVKDYGSYPEDVKKKFAGAGGCIWSVAFHLPITTSITDKNRTVAITPLRSTAYNFSDVERICQEWTMAGLEAMYSADTVKPFRFLYMSGRGVERDQSKPRSFLSQYSLMRVGLYYPEKQKLAYILSRARQKTKYSHLLKNIRVK